MCGGNHREPTAHFHAGLGKAHPGVEEAAGGIPETALGVERLGAALLDQLLVAAVGVLDRRLDQGHRVQRVLCGATQPQRGFRTDGHRDAKLEGGVHAGPDAQTDVGVVGVHGPVHGRHQVLVLGGEP
jgi:hypothetical protein